MSTQPVWGIKIYHLMPGGVDLSRVHLESFLINDRRLENAMYAVQVQLEGRGQVIRFADDTLHMMCPPIFSSSVTTVVPMI